MSGDAQPDDPVPPSPGCEVTAVLAQLGALRLRLSADLGVVASAVELEEHAIAVDVLDGVCADLTGFAAGLAVPVAAAVPPVPRRRLLRTALPAAPALAAAAALVAVLAGVLPARGPVAPATTPAPDAAAASYAELFRLHERGAPEAALRAGAHELHAEVARVMAAAWADPAGAEAALQQLAAEAGQLEDADQRADLRSVLAESQRLLAGVRDVLAAAAPVLPPAPLPLPSPVLPEPPAPDVVPSTAPPASPPPPAPADPSPSAAPAPAVTTPGTPTPEPSGSPTEWLGRPEGDSAASVVLPRRPALEE